MGPPRPPLNGSMASLGQKGNTISAQTTAGETTSSKASTSSAGKLSIVSSAVVGLLAIVGVVLL